MIKPIGNTDNICNYFARYNCFFKFNENFANIRGNKMQLSKPFLTCYSVAYYGMDDEDFFFEWIKRIGSIERIQGDGLYLYLYLKNTSLPQEDLYELYCFFRRYKVDVKQLRPFLTAESKKFFNLDSQSYGYRQLFGKIK